MNSSTAAVSVRGKLIHVPSVRIGDIDVITTGRRLRIASVRDEEYCEADRISNPEQLIETFRSKGGIADIFTFTQRITDARPHFDLPFHWANAAVVPISS